MPKLSKKAKQEWDFSLIPIPAEEHTTSFAKNVIATANKVIVSLLFTAVNSRQKGA